MNNEDLEQKYAEMRSRTLEEMDKLKSDQYLDDDGYPTEEALKLIEIWDWEQPKQWLEFIESIWYFGNWGWKTTIEPHEYRDGETVVRYHVSTIGWSGNESIIRAMEKNYMLWDWIWVQSRRGGHYIFELTS